MPFGIPFIADWQKIGEHRQQLTDLNSACENKGRIDYDYKVGQKVLLRKEGILHNAPEGIRSLGSLRQSIQMEQSWFNMEIERMNIRRVKLFEEDLDNE
jgi:hypothetical protein